MTASQPNFLELAKQGDVRAIAALVNTTLQSEGITTRVGFASDCLMVAAESQEGPNQIVVVDAIRRLLLDLNIEKAKKVVIQGRVTGKPAPIWHEIFDLAPVPSVLPEPEVVIAPELPKPETTIAPDLPGPEATITSEITIAPEATIVDVAEVTNAPNKAVDKNLVKSQKAPRKLLFTTGASLAAIALCLIIGKQAFDQATSTSDANALPVPEKQASIPNSVTTAKSDSGEVLTHQEGSKSITVVKPVSKSATQSKASPKATIAASSHLKTVATEAEKQGAKINSAAMQLTFEPQTKTATQSPKVAPKQQKLSATKNSSSKNNLCSQSAITKAIFQQCISKGITHAQVSQIFGASGKRMSGVGSITTYQWLNRNQGKVIATFQHDRLISKSQVGLK